ncbi:MAG: alkaline shock response membrane anchor protein AmaP [Bacillota bacterium]|jgi:uncharacterized alkaline shock family protein YloU|nr:alkaline shock response membrane anchor protein AmaP [Bacillota bacterium]MDI9415740.1 alkaline shock response membrane anchor protein AmaP [Bacillota bacterium]HAV20761.1 alkaline shock response membrane anchor protein AmaP [Bacillota bacterium]HOB88392.1 alkaline shock response membrane anchor protein AmaP [Bacillota bacterium]HOJ57578.1 alkaline shock response membrane anchor protein AmaP [Bacillota bacterium]
MKIHDRAVILISAILLLLVGIIFVAMAFGPNPTSFFSNVFLTRQYGGLRPIVIVLAIICLPMGGYLIWLTFRSRGRRKSIVRATGLGDVRISSLAIETLIKRGVREVPGIQDVDTVVDVSGDDLEVHVSIVVSPDVSIPGVAEQIQAKLGRYISDTIGVDVSKVTVHVRNVGQEQRPQRVV